MELKDMTFPQVLSLQVFREELDEQMQIERKALDEALAGQHQGMAIVMKGTHLCKTMRGVRSNGQMTVSNVSGLFKEDTEARREFYKLIDMQ